VLKVDYHSSQFNSYYFKVLREIVKASIKIIEGPCNISGHSFYSCLIVLSGLPFLEASVEGTSLTDLSEKSFGCWSMYSGWFLSCESVSVGLG
jgi:hypothetical protein